ncbi:DUF6531 domain-containing protein [Micromonospora sp. NPDC047074]|uniref:DUF6531 domain-containing protein n=1 Tax=Micromonospora sp. NPDC047074 TaxID=3154339 RepID=UPI0033FF7332
MGDFHIPNDPNWQWAYDAILYTVGEEFPKGDPSELKALSIELERFSANLASGIAATQALGLGLQGNLDGPAADAFAQFQQIITRPLPGGIRTTLIAGDVANRANQQIDYGQTQIVVAAFMIVLDIAMAMASGFGVSLVPAYLKIGQEITEALLDRLENRLHQLIAQLAIQGAEEGLEEGAESVIAQTIVIAKDNKDDGFSWSDLGEAIGAGVAIGTVAGGVMIVGGRYFPKLSDTTHGKAGLGAIGETLGELAYLAMVGGLGNFNALATAVSSAVGTYASQYAHDLGKALGGGPAAPDPSGLKGGPSKDLAATGGGPGAGGADVHDTGEEVGNRPRPDGTDLDVDPLESGDTSTSGSGGALSGGLGAPPVAPQGPQPPRPQAAPATTIPDGGLSSTGRPGDPSGNASTVPPPPATDLVPGPPTATGLVPGPPVIPGPGLPGFDAPSTTDTPDGATQQPTGGPPPVQRPEPVPGPHGQPTDPIGTPPPMAAQPGPVGVVPGTVQGVPTDPIVNGPSTPEPLDPPVVTPLDPPVVAPAAPPLAPPVTPPLAPPVVPGSTWTPDPTGATPVPPGLEVGATPVGQPTTQAPPPPAPPSATGPPGTALPTTAPSTPPPVTTPPSTIPAGPTSGGAPQAGTTPTGNPQAGAASSPPGPTDTNTGSTSDTTDRPAPAPAEAPPSYLDVVGPVEPEAPPSYLDAIGQVEPEPEAPPSYLDAIGQVEPEAEADLEPSPPPYEVEQGPPLSTPAEPGQLAPGKEVSPGRRSDPKAHATSPDPARTPPPPVPAKVEQSTTPRPVTAPRTTTTVEGPDVKIPSSADAKVVRDADRAGRTVVPPSGGEKARLRAVVAPVPPSGGEKARLRSVFAPVPPLGKGPWLRDVPPAVFAKSTAETVCVGDPIDVTTGRMIYTETDANLPGLPLERTHRSDYRWGRSFGTTWASTLDQRIVADGNRVWFLAADGSVLTYPLPAEGGEALPLLGRPAPLRRLVGGGWSLTDRGALLLFAPGGDGHEAFLSDVATVRTRWHVTRDDDGTPRLLESSSGDRVELRTHAGLVTGALFVPADAGDEVELPAFDYDDRHRLVAVRNSSGDPVLLDYDDDGRITRWEDRNGEWYTYAYDRAGRCVLADGNGGHLRYAFTYGDGVTVVTDSVGGVHRYELNERLQVTAVTDPLGATTREEWDAAHRLLSRTDPLGRVTRFTYDETGRRVATVLPDGSHRPVTSDDGRTDGVPGTDFDLDGLGRPRSARLPDGAVTEFGWTAEGDLAWRTGPDGSTQEWHYDGEGNLVESIDARGRSVRIEYGSFDLPTARIDEAGNRTEFAYDTELRLVAVTNPQGRVWRYTYDAAGRLATETDFDGRAQHYAYDAAGQLVARTNAAGETTHYAHDLLGRVVERRVGDVVTRLEYDADGHLAGVESPDAVVRFERDAQGRVVAETINGRTVRTSYEGDGAMARRTPSGRSSRWTLDARGRPVMLVTGGHVLRFGHDAAGREISRTVDDVVALRQTFDPAGRLAAQHIADAAVRSFDHDATDRVVAIADTLDGDRSFRADETGRIHSVAVDGTERERYDYDAAGNLVGTGGGRWEFAGSMLLRSDDARFEYDDRGRLTTRVDPAGTWRFTWDAEDRLVRATTPAGDRWRYRYDGFGRRVAKQRLADDDTVLEETHFAWAGDVIVEQTDATGTVSWDYWPDGSAPVTQTDGDDRLHTVVTDAIGTPTHLVEPGGHLRWWSRGDLWGRTSDPVGTPLRFPGQYHDAETGLHYNRFRYYDPATARYLSPDPLGLAGGPNPTAYVDDPLTTSDPLGLAHCKGGNRSSSRSSESSQDSHRSGRSHRLHGSQRSHGSHRSHRSHGEPSNLPPQPAPPTPEDLVGDPQSELDAAFDPLVTEDDHSRQHSISQLSSDSSSYDDLLENLEPLLGDAPTVDFVHSQMDWESIEYRSSRYHKLWNNPQVKSAYYGFKEQLVFELKLKAKGLTDDEIDAKVIKKFGDDRVAPFAQILAENHAFSVPAEWWVANQNEPNFDQSLQEAVEDYRPNLALWGKIGPAVAERITKEDHKRMLEASPGGVMFDAKTLGTKDFYHYPPGYNRMWVLFSHHLVDRTSGIVDAHVFRGVIKPSVLYDTEAKTLFSSPNIEALRVVIWDFVPGKNGIQRVGEYVVRSQGSLDGRVPILEAKNLSQSFKDHQQKLYEQLVYRRENYNRLGLQNSMDDFPAVERRDSNYIFIVSDASQPKFDESPAAITRRWSLARDHAPADNPLARVDQILAVLEYQQNNPDLSGSESPIEELMDEFSAMNVDPTGSRSGSVDSIPVPPARHNSAYDPADNQTGPFPENPNLSPRGSDYSPTLDAVPEDGAAVENPDWDNYDFSQATGSGRRDSSDVGPTQRSHRSTGSSRRRSSKHSGKSSRSSSSKSSSSHSSRRNAPAPVPTDTTWDHQNDPAYGTGEATYAEPSFFADRISYSDRITDDQVVYSNLHQDQSPYTGVPFSDLSPTASVKSTDETYCESDPIDVTTGRMILTETDATLPGLPLIRTYRSDYRWGRSFGPAWASALDQRIVVDGEQVRYLAEDGSILTYPLVAEGETALPTLGRALPLRRLVGGGWLLTDPASGRAWVFARERRGESLLSDVTDGGLRWSFARDDAGTVTTLRSSAGATITFTSAEGLVTGMRLPDHNGVLVGAARFGYDQDRQLVEVVNSSGDPEHFTYADGRLVRWDDRNGEWYTYTYDEAGRCVATDGKDGYLRYRFAYSDGLTVVTDSLGAVRRYELNDRLQVVAEIDGLGATTRHEWDDAYRRLSRTDPLGRTTSYGYDADGRPTVVTRPDGSRSTTSYDELGRVTSWTDFDGSTGSREFDTDGRVLAEIDASGEVVRFDRPADHGRGTAIQVGPAVVVRNAVQQVTSITTGDGDTHYEYDRLGRVVMIETDQGITEVGWTLEGELAWRENPDGSVEEFGYDGEGNLVETVDAAGRRTYLEYGAFDLVTARIDDDDNRTEYAYDTELRLTGITDPEGRTWRYAYDPNGRLVEETDFDGRTQRYAYDVAGQLIAHTDAAGEVTHFAYDLLGRVVERRTGTTVTRLTYDAADRIVSATDGDSEIRLERDAIGRVVAETVNGRTVSSSYDEQFGAVTALTRPSGAATQWSYDESGRPAVLVAGGQRLRFAYDGGREVSRSWDAGLTIEQDADQAAALDGHPDASGDVRYTVDALGRPVTRSDASGDWHLTWDHQDRLTTVTTPGGDRWHYRYDAFGRRIAKQRRSAKGSVLEETGFVWSGDLLVEQQHRGRGGRVTTTAWEYHPAVAHPVAQITDGTVHAVVTDDAGTPTRVVGTDGSGPGEPGGIPLRSGGRYLDAETGLQYDGSRYYDPVTARFLPESRTAPVPVG